MSASEQGFAGSGSTLETNIVQVSTVVLIINLAISWSAKVAKSGLNYCGCRPHHSSIAAGLSCPYVGYPPKQDFRNELRVNNFPFLKLVIKG